MDFKIITDLSVIPQNIEFNFEEMKAELSESLNYYKNLVVTEDSVKDAKSDRAKLNKLKMAVDNKRKDVKKQCLEPYNAFERQCKEIISMIDEPVLAINSQIKNFDEQKKLKKYDEIAYWFSKLDVPEFIKLEDVMPCGWSNVSRTIDSIKNDISEKIESLKTDFESIKSLYSQTPLRQAVEYKFIETLDKSETLMYAALLENQCKSDNQKEEPEPDEPVITGTFRVSGTKSQIVALREFLKKNNIDFEIVKQEDF